jgi:glycerophosphoryl diester phosphodiesterase
MGADAVECDVHLSRDGELIVMHDESLDRTSSGTGLIRDASWRAIRRLDNGAWYHRRFRGQRVPRLADLLAWLRAKRTPSGRPLRLIIEIKNEPIRYPGIAEAVVRALKRADFFGRAVVISFDHGAVKRVKGLAPRAATGLLFHSPLPDLAARVKAARASAIFPRRTLVNRKLLRAAKRLNLFVGTWTVNEPAEMKKMVRLGVGGIASNYPGRLRLLLDRKA